MVQKAIAAKKDEKYFTEAFTRISANSLAYTRLKTMRASVGMRQSTTAAAPAASKTAPAEKVKLAAKSPTKGTAAATAMTNVDVIDLRKAGLDDDNLIAAIRDAAATNFDLSPAGLKTLLGAKVTNRVITIMREKK